MQIRTLMTLIVLGLGILTTGSAQSGKEANMNTVRAIHGKCHRSGRCVLQQISGVSRRTGLDAQFCAAFPREPPIGAEYAIWTRSGSQTDVRCTRARRIGDLVGRSPGKTDRALSGGVSLKDAICNREELFAARSSAVQLSAYSGSEDAGASGTG